MFVGVCAAALSASLGHAASGTAAGDSPCHTFDLATGEGWDSATTWVSNGVPQIGSEWYGSLFTGNDNLFFASSSSAFRFANVPLGSDSILLRATLTLDQGSIAYSTGGAWTMKILGDAHDGSDFQGLSRASLLARFDVSPTVRWQVADISATRPAESPDIAAVVAARINDPSWHAGDALVIGVLNDGTQGRAETGVVKSPHSAVLHVEWADSTGPIQPCNDDADGDGYTGVQELLLGKDPNAYCAIMRADVNADGKVSIGDLGAVATLFGQSLNAAQLRYDQIPDRRITIGDLGRQAMVFGQDVGSCT